VVHVVASCAEAHAAAAGVDFALIVLDQRLPDGDGLDQVKTFKLLQPGIRIIMLKHRLEFYLARIAALVDQLVAVARLGQQTVPMNEEIDLVSMARDVIADRAPIAMRNGREIALEADHAAVKMHGNSAALTSAVANVLDNAIRAEPPAGTVFVRVSENGCLDIVDHGNGISAEDMPMIFEPFGRKSVGGNGTGLGLAIVREITDRHGIKLAVEETSGGGGLHSALSFKNSFFPDLIDLLSPTSFCLDLSFAASPQL
jgi:signal transduction histidine kinase